MSKRTTVRPRVRANRAVLLVLCLVIALIVVTVALRPGGKQQAIIVAKAQEAVVASSKNRGVTVQRESHNATIRKPKVPSRPPKTAKQPPTPRGNDNEDRPHGPRSGADPQPAANTTDEWPAQSDVRSFMWLFVYCGGQRRAGPVDGATSLADLLSLSIKLDFQVLVCVPSGHTIEPSHHPRLHWLPESAGDLFDAEVATRPFTRLEEAFASSPAGFLSQLELINQRLEFRKLMILSPFVSLGDTTDEAEAAINQMWERGFVNRFDADDVTVVTPTLIGERPQPLVPMSAADLISKDKKFAKLQSPPSTVVARGMMFAEGLGSLVTITPWLAGSIEGSRKVEEPSSTVDSPLGHISMISKAALDARLAGALAEWKRRAEQPEGSGNHKKWQVLQAMRASSAMLRVDVALATMGLSRVVSLSVRARLFPDAEGLVKNYRRDLEILARGGPDIHASVQDENILNGIDSSAPRILTANDNIRAIVRSRYSPVLRNRTTLYWDPYCSCTGINVEAINFLVPLESRMQVRAVANPDCWCKGYPEADTNALGRLMKAKGGSGDERYGRSIPDDAKRRRTSIWVTHKPVDAMPRFPYRGAVQFLQRPTYGIARTMIEVDRITTEWVRRLNDDPAIDEIWVPASFLVDAFRKSGVRDDRPIVVVPEAIDTDAYDPAAAVPMAEVIGNEAPCSHCFKFLSNFKWEHRKGWDVLLKAYFTTFTIRDNVALYLKTYLYMAPQPYNLHAIRAQVETYVRDQLNLHPDNMPRFYILTGETAASDMPGLYASMDAFVLPTRGEGWGLPFQEAMAMGLPTVGTAWGGNMEFMTDDNSYLIPVLGLAPPGGQIGGYVGSSRDRIVVDPSSLLKLDDKKPRGSGDPKCAEPDGDALKRILREIFDDQPKAKARGALAREHIIKYFSRAAVAKKVLNRLEEIQASLDAKAARDAPPPTAVDDTERNDDTGRDVGGGDHDRDPHRPRKIRFVEEPAGETRPPLSDDVMRDALGNDIAAANLQREEVIRQMRAARQNRKRRAVKPPPPVDDVQGVPEQRGGGDRGDEGREQQQAPDSNVGMNTGEAEASNDGSDTAMPPQAVDGKDSSAAGAGMDQEFEAEAFG
jgi:glycosyltransferase involved in cell wall biosynthesis